MWARQDQTAGCWVRKEVVRKQHYKEEDGLVVKVLARGYRHLGPAPSSSIDFLSDFRQVQWDNLTHKNAYACLLCPCPGLFFRLSAGLTHSADVQRPFSHSTFELKLPHVCAWSKTFLHLSTPRWFVTTSISVSSQCLHKTTVHPSFLRFAVRWTAGEMNNFLAHTYFFGALILKYVVALTWKIFAWERLSSATHLVTFPKPGWDFFFISPSSWA